MSNNKRFSFGPAILVTAAFIGPGTVLTASKAGSQFGATLLWAVAFSVLTTIVLQEMAARLGIVTGNGLSQAIKSAIANPIVRFVVLALVLLAIFVGNAAYQTGNILGAAGGVKAFATTSADSKLFQDAVVLLIGIGALVIIWIGRFKLLQLVLTILVAVMSLLFVYAAIKSTPDWGAIARGFVPAFPEGSQWIVIGLIGTTVVPYNLFLHASAAAQNWDWEESKKLNSELNETDYIRHAINSSRIDTIVSMVIGGLVTSAILITASIAFSNQLGTASFDSNKNIPMQLEPALGSSAKYLFAIGLFAAGLTSAITAPIAAGYAASGCFGWSGKLDDWRLKTTASIVVACGVLFGILLGRSPDETIIVAQIANGLLLPIIAICVLLIVNRMEIMGDYKNGTFSNVLGFAVVLIVALIALANLSSVGAKIYKQYSTPQSVSVELESGNNERPPKRMRL